MSFWNRQREDQLLFAYWMGAKRMFASFTDATIIQGFIKDFGNFCHECTLETLRHRLKRMKAEYHQEQKEK